MIELKCPNCRADIELDDSREVGFCRYCGTQILIESNKSKVDGIASVENLLLRAEQFLKENNIQKAMEYLNKVLDIDINNEVANRTIARLKTPITLKERLYQQKMVAKPMEKAETPIERSAQAMLQVVHRELECILNSNNASKGVLEGYWCSGGYETPPSIGTAYSFYYLIDDFGTQKQKILENNKNDVGTKIMSREEMTLLLNKIEKLLKDEGVDNPIVKLEKAGARNIACGRKKMLFATEFEKQMCGKLIFTEMPTYKIFFRISW